MEFTKICQDAPLGRAGRNGARSEAEINSLLVYKSPAREGGVLYCGIKIAVL